MLGQFANVRTSHYDFFLILKCVITNTGGLHDSSQNLDLNVSLHADYIIDDLYIIIRLYIIC